MRTALLFLWLFALSAFGANPSYSNFNTNDFAISFPTISLRVGASTNPAANIYVTVLYSTTNITLNQFTSYLVTTNVTVYSNAYFIETNFINYNYTTNLTVQSNAWFFSTNYVNNEYVTNVTVLSNAYFFETNFVNNEFVTNITVQNDIHVLSNAYFITTNFVNNEFVTNLFVTNIYYLNALPQDVSWSGPTNYLSYTNGSLQSYATWTPVSISSAVDETASFGNSVLLCLTNAASTNITIYPPSGYKIAAGNSATLTLTNGNIGEVWLYSASNRKTLIFQQFASP